MGARAVIFGLEGPDLSSAERAFFREADPWGFILFARNVQTPDQLCRLTSELREAAGRDVPILIDQEGGARRPDGPASLASMAACDAALRWCG